MQSTTTTATTTTATSQAAAAGTIGLCLLPSDLLHDIFLRLPHPYLHRLRSVSTTLTSHLTSPDFRRLLLASPSSLPDSTWLFLFSKRPPRSCLLLRGFHRRSARWFSFPELQPLLSSPALPPGDDLYFLAASAAFFLFASNGLRRLLVVNLAYRTVRILPQCPLGPRRTSSWRRSGFKLVADSASFRFLFAELHRNQPFLFEYSSKTDTWQSSPAEFDDHRPARAGDVHLNVSQFVLLTGGNGDRPVAYMPRFLEGFGAVDRLHVYGDGYVAVIRWMGTGRGDKVVISVVLWGLGGDEREWEMVTRVPEEMMDGVLRRRPYGVMMGCLEERGGVVGLVLVTNLRGDWGIVWLGYHRGRREWEWVPVAMDGGAKGLNMAGIAISSSFLGHWPSSPCPCDVSG